MKNELNYWTTKSCVQCVNNNQVAKLCNHNYRLSHADSSGVKGVATKASRLSLAGGASHGFCSGGGGSYNSSSAATFTHKRRTSGGAASGGTTGAHGGSGSIHSGGGLSKKYVHIITTCSYNVWCHVAVYNCDAETNPYNTAFWINPCKLYSNLHVILTFSTVGFEAILELIKRWELEFFPPIDYAFNAFITPIYLSFNRSPNFKVSKKMFPANFWTVT